MKITRLTSLARLAVVALAAAHLGACASAAPERLRDRPAGAAVVVRSTGWLNAAFEAPAPPDPNPVTKPPGGSPALQATGPWFGTVGLRQFLAGHCEIGLGVALPNPYGPDAETLAPADRFRNVGIGVWLQFAF